MKRLLTNWWFVSAVGALLVAALFCFGAPVFVSFLRPWGVRLLLLLLGLGTWGLLAFLRARKAMKRAFSGRLRYNLDDGPREKAEAMVFLCPTTSRALNEEEQVLEAAALDVKGAADAFRLGLQFLVGDWRDAPVVDSDRCKIARLWAAQGIPALLDGESVRLKQLAEVVYRPDVVRVLGIPKDV